MLGPTIVALLVCDFVGASYGQFLDTDQESTIQGKHNQLRAQPFRGFCGVDMVEVIWYDELATQAQTWADALCKAGEPSYQDPESRTIPGRKGTFGQNIGVYQGESVNVDVALNNVIEQWYNENQTVTLGEINPFSEDTAAKAGRFTQMVWALTSRLGCGACVTAADPSANLQKLFLVCDYYKAGNAAGQNTFQAGSTVGTNCPIGTTGQYGNYGLCRMTDEASFDANNAS